MERTMFVTYSELSKLYLGNECLDLCPNCPFFKTCMFLDSKGGTFPCDGGFYVSVDLSDIKLEDLEDRSRVMFVQHQEDIDLGLTSSSGCNSCVMMGLCTKYSGLDIPMPCGGGIFVAVNLTELSRKMCL